MGDIFIQVMPVRPDQRAVLVEDFQQRELRSLIVGYRKTLEQYPDDLWSRDGLAACYVKLGEPRHAIEVLRERLRLGSESAHTVASL